MKQDTIEGLPYHMYEVKINLNQRVRRWWVTCNLSYSGGRDQEDPGSKPAQANSLRPCLEKKHHKNRTGGVAQGVGPEFKPQ
jgi:hypothetical protein